MLPNEVKQLLNALLSDKISLVSELEEDIAEIEGLRDIPGACDPDELLPFLVAERSKAVMFIEKLGEVLRERGQGLAAEHAGA